MSTCTVITTNGSTFIVAVKGIQSFAVIDTETGAIGPMKFIADLIGAKEHRYYNIFTDLSRKHPNEVFNGRAGTITSARLALPSLINLAINQCINKHYAPTSAKSRFNRLYGEISRCCSFNGSSETIDVDTSVSLQRLEALEQTVERLISIIDRLLEIHPEVSIDESEFIDKDLIDNYIIAVSKNEDGTLVVETLNPDDDLTDKDLLFSKEFYVSINDVDNLLTKLHDKEIILQIDEETITVDDTDFFISAFSYKLSKISDKNKENDIESTSTSTAS